MVDIRNIRIPLGALTPRASDKEVEVVGTSINYEMDNNRKPILDKSIGFSVEFLAIKGNLQRVKLPLSTKTTIEQIKKALDSYEIVKVEFINFKAQLYSIRNVDSSITVVLSCKADDLIITSTESTGEDFDSVIL